MMQYLEELARKIGYEQIELEVVDGNDTAKDFMKSADLWKPESM